MCSKSLSRKDNIAILAGGGDISTLAVEQALKIYSKVVVIGFKNSAKPEQFKIFKTINFYQTYPGLLKKNLKILKNERIKNILFIGKIDKAKTFRENKFDLTAIKFLLKLKDKSDSSILQRLVDFFEGNGIRLISQKDFFEDIIMPTGFITKRKFGKHIKNNIDFGFKVAKRIADLGIGQSLIVEDKMIISIEAIEGTDEMIKRSKKYIKDKAVFIKVAKPKQNPKFDLPGFGLRTLKLLVKNGIKNIALESGWVMLINKSDIIYFANRNKVSIFGI